MSERTAIRLFDAFQKQAAREQHPSCRNPQTIQHQTRQHWTSTGEDTRTVFREWAADLESVYDHHWVRPDLGGIFCSCGRQIPCTVEVEVRAMRNMKGPVQ